MRRRLVKAGLVALPAVLTLRARPAWAQDGTGGMTGNTPVPPAQQGGQSENLWQGQSPWAEEPWSEDSWSGNPWAEDPGWEEGSAEEGSWGE